MIEALIPEHMKNYTRMRAEEIGQRNGSIRGVQGNYIGIIGLLIVRTEYSQAKATSKMKAHVRFGRTRFCVHTKDRSYIPKPYYECSVTREQIKDCERSGNSGYIFVSLHNLERAFILGYTSLEDFLNNGICWWKGDVNPSNDYKCKKDCVNIRIDQLEEPTELYELGNGLVQTRICEGRRDD